MENRFEVGQQVVALCSAPDNACQPRTKGKIYTVLAVSFCRKCGMCSINISGDLPYPLNEHKMSEFICGYYDYNDGLHWTFAKFFAPITEIDNLLQQAIESQDYETAATLRDVKTLQP